MRFLLKHLETRTNVIILEVGGYAPAPSTLLEIMVFFILQRELCKDFVNIVFVKKLYTISNKSIISICHQLAEWNNLLLSFTM